MTTAELTLLADLAVARLSGLATALLAILPAVLAIARLAAAAFVVFRAIPLAFVLVRLRVVAGFVAPVALTLSEAAGIFLPAGRAAGFTRALVTPIRLAPAAVTFREEPGVLLVVLLVRDVAVRDVPVRDVPVLDAADLDVAVLGFAGVDEAPRVDTRLAVPEAEMLFALAGADFAADLDFAAGLVADFAAGFAADFAADLPVAFVAFVVAFAALVVFVAALVDGLLLAGPRFAEAERAVAERAVAERAVVRVAVPADFADRRDSSSSTRS
ncbi:hypothetical protein [Acrocarpospora sp. B8E8]|uniref:hypothetical protein n=1 Tax=Acrocarpospora sp. B8E8 TaxID=3153572 RepID=UPI00325E8A3B